MKYRNQAAAAEPTNHSEFSFYDPGMQSGIWVRAADEKDDMAKKGDIVRAEKRNGKKITCEVIGYHEEDQSIYEVCFC